MGNKANYKVLITTAGVGSRLGELTQYRNKSLVTIGDKPAISYIIEAYPSSVEYVIAVGYFKEHIKEFLPMAYPDRIFTFVDIDPYNGPGSSLLFSMYCARNYLQSPFIFHACDTIVFDKIPNPEENWIGGYKGSDFKDYRSFNVIRNSVQTIKDKGAMDTDYVHIGLVGILQYDQFWKVVQEIYARVTNDQLGDVDVINKLMTSNVRFTFHECREWYDTGNVSSLKNVSQKFPQSRNILPKDQESIYIYNDYVIKFFYDPQIVSDRLVRRNYLQGIIPEIEYSSAHFYRYRFVDGDVVSKIVNPTIFRDLFAWLDANLWLDVQSISSEDFRNRCYSFYSVKTQERIRAFLNKRNHIDSHSTINGMHVPLLNEILKQIDDEIFQDGRQSAFHGDLVLDNIIKTDTSYCLLDWRQDFAGLHSIGDRYYDFAKLNHSLIINHEIINKNQYTINIEKDNGIECDILRSEKFVQCQLDLFKYLVKNGYDIRRVKILTALVWLNMAPLHHHPFDFFLFYFGKYTLWKELNEK